MAKYGINSSGEVLTSEKTGEILANFSVRDAVMFYDAATEVTPQMMRIQVRHLGSSYSVDLDLQDPQLFRQLQENLKTCKLFGTGTRASFEAHILELPPPREALTGPPPIYFRQHGFHKLEDRRYVFVCGDEVLGLPPERAAAIAPEVARAHLAYDKALSPVQAVQGLWEALIFNSKILLPVWGFTLLSAMRSILIRLNVTTFPSCAVYGGQGFGKTTICQRFSLLYDDTQCPGRRWGEVDAKSTYASTIALVSRYRDQTVLLDDMAKSISETQVRERKDLLAGVLRFASNDTGRDKMDRFGRMTEQFCTAGLIYTGEFELDNASDISRTIPVHVKEQMQGGRQKDRVFAATAFRSFLLWLLPKVDNVVAQLAQDLEKIEGDFPRLLKTRHMLIWALKLFLIFAQDCGAVSEEQTDKMFKKVKNVCNVIIDAQLAQIHDLESNACLSWYILDALQRGIIQKISLGDLKNRKQLPDCYYVHLKKDDTIYITAEMLYAYFVRMTPLYLSSPIVMNRRLIAEGVIHPRKEGRSAAKRIFGQRYLDLHRKDLLEAASKASL